MPGSPRANRFSNGRQVPCTDSEANEILCPFCSTDFAHQITCPRVASVVVASDGNEAQHGVSESVPSRGFPRFPIQGFLGQTCGFLFGSVRRFFANPARDRFLDRFHTFFGGIPRFYTDRV